MYILSIAAHQFIIPLPPVFLTRSALFTYNSPHAEVTIILTVRCNHARVRIIIYLYIHTQSTMTTVTTLKRNAIYRAYRTGMYDALRRRTINQLYGFGILLPRC